MKVRRSMRWGVCGAVALWVVAGIIGMLAPAGARSGWRLTVGAMQGAPAGGPVAGRPAREDRAGRPWVQVARSDRQRQSRQPDRRHAARIPQEARHVLAYIRERGQAPEGYVGGWRFQNRERRLPLGKQYREFDVHPKVRGRNRGPERLVVEWRSGKPADAWYTPDHYRNFLPMPSQEGRR